MANPTTSLAALCRTAFANRGEATSTIQGVRVTYDIAARRFYVAGRSTRSMMRAADRIATIGN